MSAERRAHWESKWAHDDFAARWRTASIPAEVRQAVTEGWFPPGSAVLDIGCGDGVIAAWLAQQGYDVTGVDFAEAAIAVAENAHSSVQGLTFEAMDICVHAPHRAHYTALLDRGCLHTVAAELRSHYVRNAAAAAIPGARFLLLFRIHSETTRDATARMLESLFDAAFEVDRVTDTYLDSRGRHRGIAVWMTRR